MKKIFYLVFALLFTGCEDFLDTQNYKEKDDSNFPVTEEDAEQMVTGVYSTMATAMRSPSSHFLYGFRTGFRGVLWWRRLE